MVQNVDFFGTFLKGSPQGQSAAPTAPKPAEAPASGVLDQILAALDRHGGDPMVPFTELMRYTGGSFQAVLEALGALATRRLAEEVEGGARITELGRQIAASLKPPSP